MVTLYRSFGEIKLATVRWNLQRWETIVIQYL